MELAAEIVEAFAGKNVTMVHSGKRLFDTKPEKVGKNATEWLKAHGVKVGWIPLGCLDGRVYVIAAYWPFHTLILCMQG